MKIGLLGAMPHEVALMARSMTIHRSTEAGQRTFYEGIWEGREVVLAYSRVGKVSAAVSTMLLIERFGVDRVIFTGVAGAVDPRLRVGDVVIADRLVQHDMDASPLPAFERFEIPLLEKTDFAPALSGAAADAAAAYLENDFRCDISEENRRAFGMETPALYRGLVISGDQFVAEPRKVRELRQALPGALCAEMEGAAVAQVCYEMDNLPYAVIRIISDTADHSAPVDFLSFTGQVAEYMTGGIVRALLKRGDAL